MAAWKVWVFAGVSVVLWNVFVVGLGLLAGTHLDWARRVLGRYNVIAGLVVGLLVVGWLLLYAYRRYVRARAT